jgi:cell wall assembly regulator SMI1
MLPEWLQTIDRWLREQRPDYYAELLPGLRREEIAAAERQLGIELPEALVQLYQWKGGQAEDCYDSFYYNFMFPTLQASVNTALFMKEDAEAGEFTKNWWLPTWFPFLDNGGADAMCVDVAGAFGGSPGQVIWFLHEEARRPIEFPSVEAWGQTFALSLERGLWVRSDDDEYFPVDARNPNYTDAFDELRSELWPGYPWSGMADKE